MKQTRATGKVLKRRRARLRQKRRSTPGMAPGTLIADPEAAAPRISAILYGPEEIEEIQDCAASELAALSGRAEVLWVDVTGLADVAVVQQVGAAFGLHNLALEDVVNVHQRPKVEAFDDHVFVVARMLLADRRAETEQLALFLGEGFVVTFQERPGDCFEPVRERLRRGKGRIRSDGAGYLAYALIDAVIDSYFPVLEAYGEEIEQLEAEVIAAPEPEQVTRLHDLKRELLTLRRAVWPTRDMVNALVRDETTYFTETTRVYLRDCYDHAVQLMDIVESYREIVSGLLDVYLSSLSARMNEVMKVLTIIATIFIPLSFITGLYGMNFDTASPWNMPELGWRLGYPAVWLVILAVAGGLLAFFRWKGWLGGRRG